MAKIVMIFPREWNYFVVNIIAADDMVMQGGKVSAAMLLTSVAWNTQANSITTTFHHKDFWTTSSFST